MLRAWLGYALTMLCGGAFYLLYPGRLSFYVLVLLLILPLLSLGLAALSLRRLQLDVSCARAAVTKGGEGVVRLFLRGPGWSSGVRARLTWRLENKLYPQLAQADKLTLPCNVPQLLPLPCDHCGWLVFTVESCTAVDWLGLFPLRLRLPAPALALVWPGADAAAAPADFSPAQGRPLRPKPGGGPGEDYELRPYRPGDSVTAIHWKLTAKQPTDDPILRETQEPVQEAIAVTYDHFGSPDGLDAVLARLDALERSLLEAGRSFTLCWVDPESGQVTHYGVDCPDAWQRCFRALASHSAPAAGKGLPPGQRISLPGQPFVRRIHVALTEGEVTP